MVQYISRFNTHISAYFENYSYLSILPGRPFQSCVIRTYDINHFIHTQNICFKLLRLLLREKQKAYRIWSNDDDTLNRKSSTCIAHRSSNTWLPHVTLTYQVLKHHGVFCSVPLGVKWKTTLTRTRTKYTHYTIEVLSVYHLLACKGYFKRQILMDSF